MRYIKEGVAYALIGLLIGALMSMMTMIFIGHPITVAPRELSAMLIMSIFIGLISTIFNTEEIPFKFALPAHFVLTAAIVYGTNYLLDGLFGTTLNLSIIYISVYISVWVLLIIWWHLDTQIINYYIRKRKTDKHR